MVLRIDFKRIQNPKKFCFPITDLVSCQTSDRANYIQKNAKVQNHKKLQRCDEMIISRPHHNVPQVLTTQHHKAQRME